MRRADFLKLALLAPLAKLFGWKAPEPPPRLSWPLVFKELGEPTEYTVEYVTDYYTDGSWDWDMPHSDGPGTWDGPHTATQWVIRSRHRGRGKWRTIQQSVRRL